MVTIIEQCRASQIGSEKIRKNSRSTSDPETILSGPDSHLHGNPPSITLTKKRLLQVQNNQNLMHVC